MGTFRFEYRRAVQTGDNRAVKMYTRHGKDIHTTQINVYVVISTTKTQ